MHAKKEQSKVSLFYELPVKRLVSNASNYFPRNRVCKCGAGKERTPQMCDTPGFPLQASASIVRERQRCQKLRMPRNHTRINQTSTCLLQSWRANCDIQILIYDSSPHNFDLREVSKVTDYVVAYSCKGNATLREETETTKRIILGMDDLTGDKSELQSVCKKVLNKAAASRLISKQEASVLLANMDLVVCSETIDIISISNSVKVTTGGNGSKKPNILKEYASRPSHLDNLNLHDYYRIYRSSQDQTGKKMSVPHYTGIMSTPTYPVTEEYARHVLIVYKSWREYPSQTEWKRNFDDFIRSSNCPVSCRLHYDRVVQRHFEGTKFAEVTAGTAEHNKNTTLEEDEIALALVGCNGREDLQLHDWNGIDKGIHFKWDQLPKVSALYRP